MKDGKSLKLVHTCKDHTVESNSVRPTKDGCQRANVTKRTLKCTSQLREMEEIPQGTSSTPTPHTCFTQTPPTNALHMSRERWPLGVFSGEPHECSFRTRLVKGSIQTLALSCLGQFLWLDLPQLMASWHLAAQSQKSQFLVVRILTEMKGAIQSLPQPRSCRGRL